MQQTLREGNEFEIVTRMEFQWLKIDPLKKAEIMPKTLKKAILKWTRDKKVFWVAERR